MAPLSPFASFLLGGFEGSTHRRMDGRQLDVIAATRHDALAAEDYAFLRQAGLRTVRDALRWHLIETSPGRYDWTSFLPMLRAARRAGVQVVWDLCHYGVPHGLDIWSGDFVDRFAAFAAAAATVVRSESDDIPVYSVMNEISFWAWAGGDRSGIYPFAEGRGPELKRQLVRAAIAATDAVRSVDAGARFVQPEPIIRVNPPPGGSGEDAEAAAAHHLSQYEAFDMLAGRRDAELGGGEDTLDILGVNFYWNNQWIHGGETVGFGHPAYHPFSAMLVATWERYRRPILVTETGAEGENGPAWLRYVASEVRTAMDGGVPILGICLYPVMDYPGWDNDRHCQCGAIEVSEDWQRRRIRREMALQLSREAFLCAAQVSRPSTRDVRSSLR